LCNAGHPPPLVIRGAGIEAVGSTGLPIGLFCGSQFGVSRVKLAPQDALLLYTDGVLDAESADHTVYGAERLALVAARACHQRPEAVVEACVRDLAAHVGTTPYGDDVTVMAVGRQLQC
jgi:sigma-B regulation protein RsbU (phosphoserine phosphatase)